MLRLSLLLVVASLFCGACSAHVPAYTLGRYRASSDHALFLRVLEALLDGGHVVDVADERRGRFEVLSRWHSAEHRAVFVITLVRPGWVVVGMEGDRVRATRDGFDTHPAIARALTELARQLRVDIESPRPRGSP